MAPSNVRTRTSGPPTHGNLSDSEEFKSIQRQKTERRTEARAAVGETPLGKRRAPPSQETGDSKRRRVGAGKLGEARSARGDDAATEASNSDSELEGDLRTAIAASLQPAAAVPTAPRTVFIAPGKANFYYPAKFNVENDFNDPDNRIHLEDTEPDSTGQTAPNCIHFAMAYFQAEKKGDFLRDVMQNENGVANFFQGRLVELEAAQHAVWRDAPAAANHQASAQGTGLGQLLSRIAQHLGTAGVSAHADLLVGSGIHMMAGSIQRKQPGADELFVVSFYEPGKSSTHLRKPFYTPAELEQISFEDLVPDWDDYKGMDNGAPMVVAVACPGVPLDEPTSGRFTEPLPADAQAFGEAAQTRLMLALQYGQAHEVAHLAQLLEDHEVRGAEAAGIVRAVDGNSNSPLLHAVLRGHVPAIEALTSLCQNAGIEGDAAAEVVGQQNDLGNFPLMSAIEERSAPAVRALHAMCRTLGVGTERMQEMLTRFNADGAPPLYFALHENSPDTIDAVSDLCSDFGILGERAVPILAAIDDNGISGVRHAVISGHADAIAAWQRACDRLQVTGTARNELYASVGMTPT